VLRIRSTMLEWSLKIDGRQTRRLSLFSTTLGEPRGWGFSCALLAESGSAVSYKLRRRSCTDDDLSSDVANDLGDGCDR